MLIPMNILLLMISILISVAFYTITERKILGYMQIRKGPNKVGLMGILQPLSDALKLFNKNISAMDVMNFMLSYMMPAMSLFMSMLLLTTMTFNMYTTYDIKHNILMFFVLSSLSVYFILLIGWSANSKYSYMGSIRSVAQMISYEISFFLIILFIVILSHSFSTTQVSKSQYFCYFLWGNLMLFIMWMITCIAECNRSPFDFAEGESELVSGFNVEYMGGWFALIFLAEYMSMLILSILSTIMFFTSLKSTMSNLTLIIIAMMILWIRGTYPRFRYDMLMKLSWKIFLPLSLFIITFPLMISTMFF